MQQLKNLMINIINRRVLMKILSIDWDYFIEATAEQRCTLFPDGGSENIPSYI